ncbi:MAG: radical SAM protein [Desulfobacteraceae bacterium]|nr:radical SAM protein [Desulfobacteraceae bacterium]
MKSLDAVIISGYGYDSLSVVSGLRLNIDNQPGTIQQIKKTLHPDFDIDHCPTWADAPHLNGITLFDHCTKAGFACEIIEKYDPRKNYADVAGQSPTAVIISTTYIFSKLQFTSIVTSVRQQFPDAIIIAGGTWIYASYLLHCKISDAEYDTGSAADSYLFLSEEDEHLADYYIISTSGLGLLSGLLSTLKQGEHTDTTGIAVSTPRGIVFNGVDNRFSCERFNIDWAQLPDHVFSRGVISLQASNGCPYRCAFCNFQRDRTTTYLRPLDELIADIKAVQARGIRYVRFVDDNFRLGKNDLNDTCRAFINAGLDVQWFSFIRLSSLQLADMQLLKESGCYSVQVGLESANQQILDNMEKKVDAAIYPDVISRLLHAGLNCTATFMMGFPGETEETVRQTMRFIQSMDMADAPGTAFWTIYPFMLAPLSPIYERASRDRYQLNGYLAEWRHTTMDSKTAVKHIKSMFLQIERPTPSYPEDDLDLLQTLSISQRKIFLNRRHDLAKTAKTHAISAEHLSRAFSDLL